MEADRKIDLVMVGSIALDTIETPTEKRAELLGGSVSYACAAASFFAPVGMVGIVGSDFPAEHRGQYEAFGINLEGLQEAEGRTFRWSGVYDDDMINRRTLETELNVFEAFRPDLPEAYRQARLLLLGNIAPDLQLHVLDQAVAPEFVVADTMDLWINIAREALEAVIGKVTMLTLNDSEARMLTDRHNLVDCARQIQAMGPRYVVIKKGEHGAMCFGPSGVFLAPAYPVERLTDPTGAGDTFAGAMMGALAAGRNLEEPAIREALVYGAVMASFGVESFSLTRLSTLTRPELDTRYDALRAMMRVS